MASPDGDEGSDRFAVFAFLFALAVVVDNVRVATLLAPLRAMAFVAALAVLARPSSPRRFLAMTAVLCLELGRRLPSTDNLQTVMLLLGITILGVFPLALRRARGQLPGGAWLAEIEPLVRLSTIFVYAMTFWHKLNADFLAVDTSCAVALYDHMLEQAWFPGGPFPAGRTLAPLLIGGTLAIEGGLPLLLAFPRTARIGIAAGLAFHFVLGLARFYEFSVLAVALLFLFAPPALTPALAAWWRALDRRSIRRAAVAGGVAIAGVAAIGVFQIWSRWDAAEPLRENVRFGGHLLLGYLWWLSAIPLAIGVRLLWRLPADAAPPRPRFAPSHPLLLAAPLLVLLNGLSPYLGFKTESAYAMYSNLATEGGRTNHLVLPGPLALASYQTDLVRILRSSEPELAAAARDGRPVPFVELRLRAHAALERTGEAPEIVYMRDGVVVESPSRALDSTLASPPSLWERKLLTFREIHPDRRRCGH